MTFEVIDPMNFFMVSLTNIVLQGKIRLFYLVSSRGLAEGIAHQLHISQPLFLVYFITSIL